MDNQLPSVDELIKMAQDDPEGLELLRKKLCTQLINNAPKQYQRRLHGLQFQIDMTRQTANNELHSCIKISEMMLESYQKLQTALTDLRLGNNPAGDEATQSTCADIIDINLAPEKL